MTASIERILTRRALLRLATGGLGLAGAARLVACGGVTTGTATAPSAATSPAAAAQSGAGSAASTATTDVAAPPYQGIAQGRTPDGFFTLGDAAAPVALIDYSDFL